MCNTVSLRSEDTRLGLFYMHFSGVPGEKHTLFLGAVRFIQPRSMEEAKNSLEAKISEAFRQLIYGGEKPLNHEFRMGIGLSIQYKNGKVDGDIYYAEGNMPVTLWTSENQIDTIIAQCTRRVISAAKRIVSGKNESILKNPQSFPDEDEKVSMEIEHDLYEKYIRPMRELGFPDISSLDELESQYRSWAVKNHPDKCSQGMKKVATENWMKMQKLYTDLQQILKK